jgi:hypothetical protein
VLNFVLYFGLIRGSKHGKLDQKVCPLESPFKNMIISYKTTRKYIGKFFYLSF